jgi:hypothetical protein
MRKKKVWFSAGLLLRRFYINKNKNTNKKTQHTKHTHTKHCNHHGDDNESTMSSFFVRACVCACVCACVSMNGLPLVKVNSESKGCQESCACVRVCSVVVHNPHTHGRIQRLITTVLCLKAPAYYRVEAPQHKHKTPVST